jgi:hypothetical protein
MRSIPVMLPMSWKSTERESGSHPPSVPVFVAHNSCLRGAITLPIRVLALLRLSTIRWVITLTRRPLKAITSQALRFELGEERLIDLECFDRVEAELKLLHHRHQLLTVD